MKKLQNWKKGKGRNVMPGKGRFLKVPPDEICSKRVTFLLTTKQFDVLKGYCDKKEISMSDLIKDGIILYFEKVGYEI
jgi:hypothetical protein